MILRKLRSVSSAAAAAQCKAISPERQRAPVCQVLLRRAQGLQHVDMLGRVHTATQFAFPA